MKSSGVNWSTAYWWPLADNLDEVGRERERLQRLTLVQSFLLRRHSLHTGVNPNNRTFDSFHMSWDATLNRLLLILWRRRRRQQLDVNERIRHHRKHPHNALTADFYSASHWLICQWLWLIVVTLDQATTATPPPPSPPSIKKGFVLRQRLSETTATTSEWGTRRRREEGDETPGLISKTNTMLMRSLL